MSQSIPNEVRQFVTKHISSLHQLEVLLLVSALPDREWSVDAVYRIVLSNSVIVAEQLENFVKSGLITRSDPSPLYRYAPQTEELGDQVAALSALYKTSRHKIVELIYQPQSDPLKSFSDAFKFKQNK